MEGKSILSSAIFLNAILVVQSFNLWLKARFLDFEGSQYSENIEKVLW